MSTHVVPLHRHKEDGDGHRHHKEDAGRHHSSSHRRREQNAKEGEPVAELFVVTFDDAESSSNKRKNDKKKKKSKKQDADKRRSHHRNHNHDSAIVEGGVSDRRHRRAKSDKEGKDASHKQRVESSNRNAENALMSMADKKDEKDAMATPQVWKGLPVATLPLAPRTIGERPISDYLAAKMATAKSSFLRDAGDAEGSGGNDNGTGILPTVTGVQVGYPFGVYPLELTTTAAQNLAVTGITSTVFVGAANDATVDVNPRDSRHYVAAWAQQLIDNGGAFFIGTARTHDGGLTWTTTYAAFPSYYTAGRVSQPRVKFDSDGRTIYLSFVYFNTRLIATNGTNQGGVAAFLSRDGGRNWIYRAVITSPSFGFPPQPNNVTPGMPANYTDATTQIGASYVTPDPFRRGVAYEAFDLSPNADLFHSDAWFGKTTDGGRTWAVQLAYNPFADPNLNSNGVYDDVRIVGARVVVPKRACPFVVGAVANVETVLAARRESKTRRVALLKSKKSSAKETIVKMGVEKKEVGESDKLGVPKLKDYGGDDLVDIDDGDSFDPNDGEWDDHSGDENDSDEKDPFDFREHTNLLMFAARIYAAPDATSAEYIADSLPFNFTRSDVVVIPRLPPAAPGSAPQWSQESYIAVPNVTVANVYTNGYTYSGTNPPPGTITGGTGTLTGGNGLLVQTGTGGGAFGNLLYGQTVSRKTGALYVSVPIARAGDSLQQIGLAWSTDGGKTWTAPVQVNRTPQTAFNPQAFTSSLATDGHGLIAVLYYDFRATTTTATTLAQAWVDVYQELPGGGINPVSGFVQEFNVGPNAGAAWTMQNGADTVAGLATTGDYATIVSPSRGVFATTISASPGASVTNPPVVVYSDPTTFTVVEADINYRSQIYFSRVRVTNSGGGGGGCAGCAGCNACSTCPPGATCVRVNQSCGSCSNRGGGFPTDDGTIILRGDKSVAGGARMPPPPRAKCDNCIPR